jgi:tRNA A58 N-methylase Trm61
MTDVVGALLLFIVAALFLSLLLFQAITGVPPHAATRSEAADVVALLRRAGLAEHAVIYELGCGWGTLVLALAQAFPHARIVGIEISPFPYWIARLRTRNLGNVSLRRGNFYHCDLQDAEAVVCYLMMKPMPKVAAFLDGWLREDTPVVALTFWFRDRETSAVLEGPGLRGGAALYRWRAHKFP